MLPLILDRVGFASNGIGILSDISTRLPEGGLTVILGPNGAGKSVLLRLCHGLLRPTAGAIRWADPEAAARPGAQAMVFQRPVLLRRSALANVAYALAVAGIGWRERRRRASEALERVGLAHLRDRPARVLSGGEQQRVTLARAWALRPRTIFLDEPTAALDPGATRAIEGIVQDIRADGATVVMATHDMGQARRLADRVWFLDRGRLVEDRPADAFFTAPDTPAAAAFVRGELAW